MDNQRVSWVQINVSLNPDGKYSLIWKRVEGLSGAH